MHTDIVKWYLDVFVGICTVDYVLYSLHLLCICHYLVVLLGLSSMEVKTEADGNDVTECSHDDKPAIGMLGYSLTSPVVSAALN